MKSGICYANRFVDSLVNGLTICELYFFGDTCSNPMGAFWKFVYSKDWQQQNVLIKVDVEFKVLWWFSYDIPFE